MSTLAAFRVGEFRAMWAAEALSQAGDQLARVALSVLVFSTTGSAALAALTLGLSYTPALLGSALLSGLADRFPRREVMVGCDLVSTALLVVMALPGTPLWLLCVAMAGVALVGGPFKSARLALLPEVLTGEVYVAGLAVRNITIQTAQLLGFAGGGALVVLLGPSLALALDAATFLLSALLVRFGVRHRPAATDPTRRRPFWTSSIDGARLIGSIPGLPALFVIGMLSGLYIAPEGLGAPWIAEMGAPAGAVGLVMGAPAAGLILGVWLFTRFLGPARRERLVGPVAALAGLSLVVCVVQPGLWAALACLVASGIFTAFQVQVGASFGQLVPADGRAQVMGLLNSGVLTAQGIGVLLAGVLAQGIGVARTVAVFGLVGAVLAVPMGLVWTRARARAAT